MWLDGCIPYTKCTRRYRAISAQLFETPLGLIPLSPISAGDETRFQFFYQIYSTSGIPKDCAVPQVYFDKGTMGWDDLDWHRIQHAPMNVYALDRNPKKVWLWNLVIYLGTRYPGRIIIVIIILMHYPHTISLNPTISPKRSIRAPFATLSTDDNGDTSRSVYVLQTCSTRSSSFFPLIGVREDRR